MPQRNHKEQLLAGGLDVLHSRGFNGCSVQEIVDAAGVPKGSFYNHFASKEELAVEALRRYAAGMDVDALVSPSDEPPLARLRSHFAQRIERSGRRGLERGCLLGNFATELAPHSALVRETAASLLDHWSDVVRRVLEEAQLDGELAPRLDARMLALSIVDGYEGAVARAKVSRDRAPLDAFLSATFDVLLA